MRIVTGDERVADDHRGAVVAIGNFDGIHRGHQVVLSSVVERARARGSAAGLITFAPHPRTFFAPHNPVFKITPVGLKSRLIRALGLDFMAVLDFNYELAALSPERFVAEVLVDRLGAAHVVTGADFRFGKARSGDIDTLRQLGARHGFEVTAIDQVGDPEGDLPYYSSTSVRQALLHGNPRAAAEILGYWWTVLGEVVRGDQRGRTIGFPTINIIMDENGAPRLGIYAVRVRAGDGCGSEIWRGAGYIGRRPTFDKDEVVLEVFLFDHTGELYGRTLMVEFIEFVRGDHKFDTVEELKRQMDDDCREIERILAAQECDGDPMTAFALGRAQAQGAL
ncbi:MAG: bifunctional riboflavin kinase/FAD synthetase [Hyphomicrobiales bacterium]